MKKTLWEKSTTGHDQSRAKIQSFTAGEDRNWDLYLAPFDVLGSIAHVKMLAKVGLLESKEAETLCKGLVQIHSEIEKGQFSLQEGVEDVHSQVELLLTERLGEVGKKIHMARSRNDQVLLDIKLYLRNEIEVLAASTQKLFDLLIEKSKIHQNDLMPGYTHFQLAMPSSFGLWFGAYAESLVDDLQVLQAAFEVVNKNPLGSAAGFGSSFPIDRRMTTQLLGFSDLSYNVVYAQMGRGKVERIVASSLANFADTLSKMSMDVCLFLNQNFSFLEFPDELTTGSSIMPHKKNPDVFELIRARCNRLKALPNEIMLITSNLPSGYHRDMQLIKEHLFPAFAELRECLEMAELMLSKSRVKKDLLNASQYLYLYSVEEVNRLVLQGIPFRDAYRKIGEQIEAGQFKVTSHSLHHTHEGSIGNLSLDEIRSRMKRVQTLFSFDAIRTAFSALIR